MSNIVQCEYTSVTEEKGAVTGIIDHTTELSENIGSLYLNEDCSDVAFIVEGEKCVAHRVILASRSYYFRAMLCGGMRETEQKEIPLPDTSIHAFKLLLKYIYTGLMPLGKMNEDTVLEILELSHKYVFEQLQTAISDYLTTILNVSNFCCILNASMLYSLSDLAKQCLSFGDLHSSEVLQLTSLMELSPRALETLVRRNSFYAPEIEIFEAIQKWIEYSPERKEEFPSITSLVRLALIPKIALLDVVRTSGLVSADDVLDAIAAQCCVPPTGQVVPRGVLKPDVNVASASLEATVLTGQVRGSPLSGDLAANFIADTDSPKFTRHSIDDKNGITVVLKSPHIINTIRLFLPDREQRMYSYRLYVGMFLQNEEALKPQSSNEMGVQWVEIVDYSRFLCRSAQTITFPAQAVMYIRVVGVPNCTLYSKFHLVAIEALYSTEAPFKGVLNGVPIPWDNVATVDKCATVIEGVSRSRNALLNGQTTDYDWDNGYTCHQIGSGSITVQFPQPYIISSMRMLLWDLDERYYSYYVEVSVDQETWKRVSDRSNRQCRSWQMIEFEKTPVVFVRVVGTCNSANEVFHLVHLECPARADAPPLPENSVVPPIETIDVTHAM